MATCLHLYKKSTLPPLLDRYLPVNSRNQNDLSMIETDNKKKAKTNKYILSDEDKDELIQRSLQEKRYLETYENMYKLKDFLSKRYRTLLNEKVRKQRIQIKMSDLKGQQHLKHKTKKIIGLQNDLTKLGILKNQQDNENFWKLIQAGIHGSKLKEKLPDIKAKMLATKSLRLSTSARTSPVQPVGGFKNSSSLTKHTDSLLPSVDTCQSPEYHMRKQASRTKRTVYRCQNTAECARSGELFVSRSPSTIWNESEQQVIRGKLASIFSKWEIALQELHQNIKNFERKQKDVEAR